MADIIGAAEAVALLAHAGQTRKYPPAQPYIVHPMAVAGIVSRVTDDEEMIAAALLHDVLEDTSIVHHTIYNLFGERVASLVLDLTDVAHPDMGNRETRKEIDRQHTAKAHPDAKTIKLADLIDNSWSIIEHDPKFAKVYMAEKRLLLEVLTEGHPFLYARAQHIVTEYYSDGGYRTHTCSCGFVWTARVELDTPTANVSGEPTPWCPNCSKRAIRSSEVFHKLNDKIGV